MNQSLIIIVTCGFTLLAVIGAPIPQVLGVKTSLKTNIILVMCDDLGWGDVGFNGGKKLKLRNSIKWQASLWCLIDSMLRPPCARQRAVAW